MVLSLEAVSCNDSKVAQRALAYLDRMSCYYAFDREQSFRIYITSAGDFAAFESLTHRLQFTNPRHKLLEIISSRYAQIIVTYDQLYNWLISLQS